MPLSKAYTLAELIITVALVAIISISVVPRFLQITQFKQQVFLKQVINSLSYIQNLAIGTGCHISVIPNSNSIAFNLRQNCTSGLFNQAIFDPQNINNTLILNIPGNITVSAVNFPIYFDSNGLAYSITSNTIIDASMTINGKSFSITGNTGLISE